MINQKHNSYDVTIVGAGPAGSFLAYRLAGQGIKVLVLEKEKLPRAKVCAGGITVRAASLLPFKIDEVIEDVIYGVRLSYHLVPKRVRTYDKPVMYMVMREKFDYLLASRAREAGAFIEDGVSVRHIDAEKDLVRVQTNQDTFETPILAGADGANSAVVHSLGLRKGFEYGLGVSGQLSVGLDKSPVWNGLIGLDYGIPGGYAWVFPKQDRLSVGAGSSFREARRLKPYTLKLIQAYDLGDGEGDFLQGHLMPLRRANTPLIYHRVLLVGDAAGLIDPLTGEGIYSALRSSDMAAAAITRFLEGKTADLQEYEDDINTQLMPELKTARTIQKLNSATPRVFFYFLKENDRFFRAFCRLLRGEKTYAGVKQSLYPPLRILFRIF
jgi:geranylgeranyl reductase family protein